MSRKIKFSVSILGRGFESWDLTVRAEINLSSILQVSFATVLKSRY